MKYALIGCGRIAPNHIKAAINNIKNGIEISAICDLVPEKMTALANRFSFDKVKPFDNIKRFTDYKEMLETVRPDIVAIATESGSHAAVALDCIAAGCDLIIEKPIALSMSDARKIISAAKKAGVTVCTNHQNRFNLSVQCLKNAIDNGDLGNILHGSTQILWSREKEYFAKDAWRGTWASDGGTLMNQCIHAIDLLRWMLGGKDSEIDEVYAVTERLNHDYIEAEDIGMAIIRFKNGRLGMIEGTSNVFEKTLEENVIVFGSDGTVKLGGSAANKIDFWNIRNDRRNAEDMNVENSEQINNVYGNGHTSVYTDMLDAIKNRREPYVTAKDGMQAVELVLAIYKSAAEGRAVKLPLDECSTADFIGRFGKTEKR